MTDNNHPNTEPFDQPVRTSYGGQQPTEPLPRYGTPEPSATGGWQQPPHEAPATPEPVKDRRRYGAGMVVGTALLAGLVGGIGGAGAATLLISQNPGGEVPQQQQALTINNPAAATPITAAASKAAPSVVTISVVQGSQGGSGSGVVIDDNGHILTNNHVVTLGGQASKPTIQVKSAEGKVFDAELVGRDSLSDLAVLKVTGADLPAIELAESSKLNVGDGAIAIGAPLGLDGTVTDGIISRLNRTISVQSSALPGEAGGDSEESGPNHFDFRIPGLEEQSRSRGSIAINVIQTDAAINQGNSGGALVDSQGKLIGINVAIASSGGGDASGNIGVGFAIPIDYAKRIAADIIEHGQASHGLLGVQVRPKSPNRSGAGSHFSVGAEIVQVVSGSAADKAGLRRGDVITAVEQRHIEDALTLNAAVREYPAGAEVTVRYLRNDRDASTTVTLGDLANQ